MSVRTRYQQAAAAFADSISHFLLPSNCLLCGMRSQGAICTGCLNTLPTKSASRCTRCGLTLAGEAVSIDISYGETCGACLNDPPPFDSTLIIADYAPPIDVLVQDLKFRARLPLARAFGELLSDAAVPLLRQTDLPAGALLPVPLSRERLEARGFNQALELARPVARALQLPLLTDTCVRIRDTSAQAMLPLSERRVNMRGAFAVRDRKLIENQHVLVIDDVMTTGHTLRELAACLKRHGAARVSNLVLTRTPAR